MDDNNPRSMDKEMLFDLRRQYKETEHTNNTIKNNSVVLAAIAGLALAAVGATLPGLTFEWTIQDVVFTTGITILGGSLVGLVSVMFRRPVTVPLSAGRITKVEDGKVVLSWRYKRISNKSPEDYYKLASQSCAHALLTVEEMNESLAWRFNASAVLFVAGILGITASGLFGFLPV